MDGIPWELDEMSQPGTPGMPVTPAPGGNSPRLKATIPRRISSGGRSTYTTEHDVLPSLPKLHGRKYAASLTSLPWRRESPDETCPVDAVPETDASSLGRRARFKRFVKGILKI